MISAVVLAARGTERMAEQSSLLPLRDKPALQWVLEAALTSNLHEAICVVPELETVRRQITLIDERLTWLVHCSAEGGQSSSFIAGLWAIDPKSDGVLCLAGDQPFIQSDLIDALIDRFEAGPALVVAASFQGQTRTPAIFRREIFPELLNLTGDRNGLALLEKYRDKGEFIAWYDGTPFTDIGARKDYGSLKEPA